MPLTILIGIYSPFAVWNVPAEQVDALRRQFPAHTFLHARSDAEALALIAEADIAFMPELKPEHLAAARRLKWAHSPAAGVGGMLFPAMIDAPVVMTNSRGISADTIAEHVLAVTLALFRKLPLTMAAQHERRWVQEGVVAGAPLRLIGGSSVLIVGLGAIGAATAARFHALGARVTGVRRQHTVPFPEGVQVVEPPDRLGALLPHADVVVLAIPQTRETSGLIGAAELRVMRRDAVLVNVGRGALVDEAALVAALTAPPGHPGIGGAALDVFEQEPLPASSPFWGLPNVIVTPHVAGFRPEHWSAVREMFAGNLRRFEAGAPLHNLVDKHAGY